MCGYERFCFYIYDAQFKVLCTFTLPCPRHWLQRATCEESRYSCNLVVSERIEGIVIQQYAAHARTKADVLRVWCPLTTRPVSTANLFTHCNHDQTVSDTMLLNDFAKQFLHCTAANGILVHQPHHENIQPCLHLFVRIENVSTNIESC